MADTLAIDTAEVFEPLLYPARYKAAFGGRGSGKSQAMTSLVPEDALRWPGMTGEGLRIVFVREVQKSLQHSKKALIEGLLQKYGLGEAQGFKVFADKIELPRDGIALFQGMQDHTAESIKSLEGFHVADVEEAQSLSDRSLQLLRPTIRWEGSGLTSEIRFSWNPTRKTDPVDALFRGPAGPPTGSVVIKANWSDNPWFPSVLEQERQDCLKNQPDQYDHIWEGGYATVGDGAYFARQIADAKLENRIGGHIARDKLMTTRAFWDIGGTSRKSDATAIWVAQWIGHEIRWLDYYEAQGQEAAAHVAWLRSKGYGDALQVLPHDGVKHDTVYSANLAGYLRQAGFQVEVVENQGAGAAMQRIEAARRLFPQMHFDAKCEAGLLHLGWYHEKRSVHGYGLGPEHDDASHAADAFGLGCIAYREPSSVLSLKGFKYPQPTLT